MMYTAAHLADMGCQVGVFANDPAGGLPQVRQMSSLGEAMGMFSNIIMGIPFSKDGNTLFAPLCAQEIFADEILAHVQPHHRIAVGMPGGFLTSCAKRGAVCIDYNSLEEFALYNAVPTAEAVLALLISNLPTTISDSSILILGYGRIGKALAGMLKGLGANVTATARKATDFAMMDIAKINSLVTGSYSGLNRFDAVVNTIPHATADEGFYVQLGEGSLIIDASSYPGHMDGDCAKRHGVTLIGAFGLPGKTAPATSGKIISKIAIDIFSKL